jgi:hypothetical protein
LVFDEFVTCIKTSSSYTSSLMQNEFKRLAVAMSRSKSNKAKELCGSQWHTSTGETTTNTSILPTINQLQPTQLLMIYRRIRCFARARKPSAQLLRDNTHSTLVPSSEGPIPVGGSWHQISLWTERPTHTKVQNRGIQPKSIRYHETEIRLHTKEPTARDASSFLWGCENQFLPPAYNDKT